MSYTREQGKAALDNAATFKKALGHDVAPESIIGLWLGMANLLAQVIADCDKAEAERDRAVACIENARAALSKWVPGTDVENQARSILAEYDKEAEK